MRSSPLIRSLAASAATILFLSSSLLAHAGPASMTRPTTVWASVASLGMISRGGSATGAATRASIAAHLTDPARGQAAATAHAESEVPGPAGIPGRVDLSASAPPVGDQGALGSCASWAFGYYLRGYYALRDGYYPSGSNEGGEGGLAAGYLYSQLAAGNPDAATSAKQNVDLLTVQGIVANADFSQGNDQLASQPTAEQTALAARYRIAGHRFIESVPGSNRAQIESLMAAGSPVVLNIALTGTFYAVSADSYLFSGPSAPSDPSHDIAAFGYDSAGVWVENSWGTGWGKDGWAELSWGWLETNGLRFIDTITPLTPTPLPSDMPATSATIATLPTSSSDPGAITPIGSSTSSGAPQGQGAAAPSSPATVRNSALAVRQLALELSPAGTVRIRWLTNLPTSSQAYWRDSSGQIHATPRDRALRLAHVLSLPSLVHGQPYEVWVRGTSANDRTTQSAPIRIVAP